MAVSVTGTPQSFEFTATGTVCTYSGGGTADSTTFDVLCVNSDNTVATPSGWTLSASRVSNQGSYVYTKNGGTTTATIDLGGGVSTNTSVLWVRVTGAAAVDTPAVGVAGADASPGSATPSFTSGVLAANTDLALAFAALHALGGGTPTSTTWTAGYTEKVNGTNGGVTAGVYGSVATKVPAGTAAESPQFSWTNTANDRYILFIAFTAFSAGVITPNGLAIPITLGSPTVSASLTVVPTGIAIPVALGSPTVVTSSAPPATQTGGSWWQLAGIEQTNRQNAQQERLAGPLACPNDGEPLLWDPRSKRRRCPYDGWISPV